MCLFDVSKFFKIQFAIRNPDGCVVVRVFFDVSKSFEMEFAIRKPDVWIVVGVSF